MRTIYRNTRKMPKAVIKHVVIGVKYPNSTDVNYFGYFNPEANAFYPPEVSLAEDLVLEEVLPPRTHTSRKNPSQKNTTIIHRYVAINRDETMSTDDFMAIFGSGFTRLFSEFIRAHRCGEPREKGLSAYYI